MTALATAIPYELAEATLAAARAKGVMIATAESCTGGMIIGSLTEVAGSSDVVERGFITYSNTAKREMLGVSPVTLAQYGAVSEQVAREMAEGAVNRSAAQIAVAVTGIAGPGGSEHKPEGRVCFGLSYEGHVTVVKTVDFGPLGRAGVRSATIVTALEMLQKALGA
ncbi:CinA family protein [Celeribacter sp. HF31]|uniref:CinA family protein n=1 Tax=Celeribacter sp. HF31 TaxID=2721558 RepID=UPI0014303DBD|nr:nicotinamide-nucleotide amidohydrolase family protein [Celeribacter sp. HF31]NIY78802.1 CinA family protein [Celeribacter sp. HF31]